jgi:Ni,Fe-hydrogenase III small subunit
MDKIVRFSVSPSKARALFVPLNAKVISVTDSGTALLEFDDLVLDKYQLEQFGINVHEHPKRRLWMCELTGAITDKRPENSDSWIEFEEL